MGLLAHDKKHLWLGVLFISQNCICIVLQKLYNENMTTKLQARVQTRRRTVTLHEKRLIDIAQMAVDMTAKLRRTVARQEILDALVYCLKDKEVRSKVENILQQK